MIDITELIIGLYEKIIPKYIGKENPKDLTKEDVDKFMKEYLEPSLNETYCRMVNITDEDIKELEEYKRQNNQNIFTKTIQTSKIVFDTNILKVGQNVKYLEKWTKYDVINYEDGYIEGVEEIDCIIRKVSENNITLFEIKERSEFLEDREIVYHNIYRVKAEDNYKIKIKQIEE